MQSHLQPILRKSAATARSLFAAGLALAVLLGAGCDSSSTSVASGGVGGSGVSRGPVSDFGSIFVTGTRWDTGTATIEIDGMPALESDLELGMTVEVDGELDGTRTQGTADRVRVDEFVEGPIRSVTLNGDDTVATIDVFGITVLATDGVTVLDDSGGPAIGIGDFAVDDMIEVYGLEDDTGAVRATRVERNGTKSFGVSSVDLTGTVSNENLDGAGLGTFEITNGGVTVVVTVDALTDQSSLSAALDDGDFVEIDGILTNDLAVRATRLSDDDRSISDQTNFEIEGVMSGFIDFTIPNTFFVGGIEVDPRSLAGVVLIPNDISLYRDGVTVEIEGDIVGGILNPDRIKLRGFDIEISAYVDSVNTLNASLVMLGITVETDSATQFEDDASGALDDLLAFTEIAPGDFLSIRGVQNGSGGVLATRVEREDPDDLELQAFVENVNGTVLRLLGQDIDVDGASFEDADDNNIAQSTFLAQVMVDDLIKIEENMGVDATPTLLDTPTDVEFETPEGGSPGLPPSFFPGVEPAPVASSSSSTSGAATTSAALAPPPAEVATPGELYAATPPPAEGAVVVGAGSAPATTTDETVPIEDAVRLYFARIEQVAAEAGEPTDSDASATSSGE